MVFDDLHASVQAGYSHIFAKYPDHHPIILICGTFLIHQFFYYSFYLPYIVVDAFPLMRKRYKIQAHKPNTAALHWNCLKTLLKNNFLSQLPMIVMVPLLFKFTRMSYTDPIPAFTTVGWHLLVSIFLEDSWHYWAHRALHHWGFLYRKIHKMHHEHTAPFGITAEYASHFETMILGVGTMLGPLLLQQHYFTMIMWLALRVVQTIDAHSGYDLPWSPHNLIPFYGGALYHDFHHSNIKGNYSSTFTWWDRLLGTDTAFKRHQVRCGGKRAIGVAKDALSEVSEK